MCHARHASHHRAARRPERDVPSDDPGFRTVRTSTPGEHPELRVSDAERESAVTLLREHGAAGRLDVAELEQRVAGAYGAKTRGDLRALLRDLPDAQLPAPRPARQRIAPHDQVQDGGWAAFVAVNVILVAIWAFTGAGYFWPGWVMASWALALVLRTGPRLLRLR